MQRQRAAARDRTYSGDHDGRDKGMPTMKHDAYTTYSADDTRYSYRLHAAQKIRHALMHTVQPYILHRYGDSESD